MTELPERLQALADMAGGSRSNESWLRLISEDERAVLQAYQDWLVADDFPLPSARPYKSNVAKALVLMDRGVSFEDLPSTCKSACRKFVDYLEDTS